MKKDLLGERSGDGDVHEDAGDNDPKDGDSDCL